MATLCLLFNLTLDAQVPSSIDKCGSDNYLIERLQNDPEFAIKFKEWTSMSESAIDPGSRSAIGCTGANSVVVPVAIHYNTPITCADFTCLLSQAQAQIDVLNEDFGATNVDLNYYTSTLNSACPTGYPLSYASTGGGSCIQFCLATQSHPTDSGLADGEPAITVGDYTWPNTNGDWPGYLNIFVSSGATAGLGNGTLGISALPGAADGDGFFVGHDYFGAPGVSCTSGATLNTSNSYGLGRTATHEAGHYFGLYHTFQGGCNDGDSSPPGPITVNDTPPQQSSTGGCPNVTSCATGPTSCGGAYTPFYNYMDYSNDACLVMFTEDQSSVINHWGNTLAWETDATVCGVISTGLPTPNFTPDGTTAFSVCSDNTDITFMDMSSASCGQSITGWSWTFSGAGVTPATSSVQNPTVSVTTSGTLTATLTLISGGTSSSTTSEAISITIIASSDPACATMPCTDWDAGPYTTFSQANMCFAASQSITAGFQVYGNESYLLTGLDPNVDYSFDFCNGYSASTWSGEAVITVVENTSFDGTTWGLGAVLTYTTGCSVTFSVPTAGDYIVVVSVDGDCGGVEVDTNNGTPTFSAANCYSCGNTFTDLFGESFNYASNESNTYEICPDNASELLTITFTAFEVEEDGAGCYDELTVYNGLGTTDLNATLCGSLVDLPNGGVIEATDFGECLTFVFTSDNSVTEGGWVADISCCTCSQTGPNFSATDCGCPVAINAGGPVSTTMVDNTCTPATMNITDFGLAYLTSENDEESSRSVACPITETSPNQSFFAIQCDSDTAPDEILEIMVNDIDTGGNIDVALFGPVTGGCPNYSGGAMVACNDGNTNVIVNTTVQDNEVYIVVISTENEGTFSIESTINATALPVELVSLNAVANNRNITINWTTLSETNNNGFELQRSLNAKDFEVISWIEGANNSNENIDYKYIDIDISQGIKYYYRLRQIDMDGKSEYSNIVDATIAHDTRAFGVYPNPSTGTFYLNGVDQGVDYIIYDKLGKTVAKGTVGTENSPIVLNNIDNGVYQIAIYSKETSLVKPLIIIK